MATQNEHGKLIAAAAKAALAPLGCKRQGQSRLWLSDERFYVTVLDFQPSGFAKGSYLNVGPGWLWRTKSKLYFDRDYQRGGFIRFESAEQFMPLVEKMAADAAQAVREFRETYRTIAGVAAHIVSSQYVGWWGYHAAIAAGLAGDVTTAEHLFRNFEAWAQRWPKIETDGPELLALLRDRPRYLARIRAIIAESRDHYGLPLLADCFEGAF